MDGSRQLRRLPPRLDRGRALTPFPPDQFVDRLVDAGVDFFTGVPCSLVGPVIAELEARGVYHGETREDAALGVAAGAYLGGKLPMVVMQNSGLGVSLNALGSLHILYEMPVLLLVTWRGFEGKDAPEHIVMGDVMLDVFDVFGIPHREPEADNLLGAVDWAVSTLRTTGKPVAIVVRPGVFTEHH